MKKTLTLACLAATLTLGLSPGPAFASRVDGGQPSDFVHAHLRAVLLDLTRRLGPDAPPSPRGRGRFFESTSSPGLEVSGGIRENPGQAGRRAS